MNRQELETKLSAVTKELLRDKGYIGFPDVFMALGHLNQQDFEAWRFRRVPYLERVIHYNLSQISFIMKTVRKNCVNGKLKPSWTAYMSWGKGRQERLRFSKSGTPAIEEFWATHFVRAKPPEASQDS